MNRLYYGDCLTIMSEWPSACVDLIYLDPPFNSDRNYNAIYKDETGRPLPDQIEAFCDMWELDDSRLRAIRTMPVLMRENGIADSIVELWRLWMQALRGTQPKLLAYLSYMAERLLIMRRILKPTGSLYFHCDPTASHYVKALLDAIFGHANFQNEITWQRFTFHADAKRFGRVSDRILFYSKQPGLYRFGRQYVPYAKQYLESKFTHEDERGRFRLDNLNPPGGRGPVYEFHGIERAWRYSEVRMRALDDDRRIYTGSQIPQLKRYLDELDGRAVHDVWTDIPSINSQAKERLGFKTQKPLALMERIVNASSNPGDMVLDPFCGCATTMEAAHKLGRQWIGIDIAIHAIKRVARVRLSERLGLVEDQDFKIEGVPRTVEGARDLWRRDKYHFQKWAVEQADGFVTSKRTADGGIDGRIYFAMPYVQGSVDEPYPPLESMVVEVKGGSNVNVADWRALKGVLSRDDALLAGLIIMEPLGGAKARNFTREVMDLEPLRVLEIDYPRMQILTVGEILEGKRFMTPTVAGRHEPQPRFPGIPA